MWRSTCLASPPLIHHLHRSVTYLPAPINRCAVVNENDSSLELHALPELASEPPRQSNTLRHHTSYSPNTVTAVVQLGKEESIMTASTADAKKGPHYLCRWRVALNNKSLPEQPREEQRFIQREGGALTALVHSARSDVLFAASDQGPGIVYAWNLERCECVCRVRLHEFGVTNMIELNLPERGTGNLLATASHDGDLAVWDMALAVQAIARLDKERAQKRKSNCFAGGTIASRGNAVEKTMRNAPLSSSSSLSSLESSSRSAYDNSASGDDVSGTNGIVLKVNAHEGGVQSMIGSIMGSGHSLVFSAGRYDAKTANSSDILIWSYEDAAAEWPRVLRPHKTKFALRGHNGQVVSLAIVDHQHDRFSSQLISVDSFGSLRVWCIEELSSIGSVMQQQGYRAPSFGACVQQLSLQQHSSAKALATTPPAPLVMGTVAPFRYLNRKPGYPAGCKLLAAVPSPEDKNEARHDNNFKAPLALLSSVGATFEVLHFGVVTDPDEAETAIEQDRSNVTRESANEATTEGDVFASKTFLTAYEAVPSPDRNNTKEPEGAGEIDDESLLRRLVVEPEGPCFSSNGIPLSLRRRRTHRRPHEAVLRSRGKGLSDYDDEASQESHDNTSLDPSQSSYSSSSSSPSSTTTLESSVVIDWDNIMEEVGSTATALMNATTLKSKARAIRPPPPSDRSEEIWMRYLNKPTETSGGAHVLAPKRALGYQNVRQRRQRSLNAKIATVNDPPELASLHCWTKIPYAYEISSSRSILRAKDEARARMGDFDSLKSAVEVGVCRAASTDDMITHQTSHSNGCFSYCREESSRPKRAPDPILRRLNELRHTGL